MASKQQFKITLPSGEKVWACGETVSEAFINFAKAYGGFFMEAEQSQKKIPTLQQFVDETYRPSFIAGLKPTTQISYESRLKRDILPCMAHLLREQKAAGSNPVTPTTNPCEIARFTGVFLAFRRFDLPFLTH